MDLCFVHLICHFHLTTSTWQQWWWWQRNSISHFTVFVHNFVMRSLFLIVVLVQCDQDQNSFGLKVIGGEALSLSLSCKHISISIYNIHRCQLSIQSKTQTINVITHDKCSWKSTTIQRAESLCNMLQVVPNPPASHAGFQVYAHSIPDTNSECKRHCNLKHANWVDSKRMPEKYFSLSLRSTTP